MSEIVNPYIAGAPVTEKRMFFGRQDIFQWIEHSIAGQYADHILVIHGQRRVGKTSVLKQLGNQLPRRFIPVFFDLQGRTHTTLDHFLWWLAREIVRVLKQERGLDVPPPDKDAFSADPETFENQFLAGLRTVLGKDTLLLTFDEFDNLEESEVKEELARPLIDYLRRMMGETNLNFIFSIGSSGRKLENMQADYTEFFKAALYKKISFLSEEQTYQLVTRPVEGVLKYEREAMERIYSITSGHPYFTQLTCHELFARCQRTDQRRIGKADVEGVLEDVVERGTVNLKFVWDEASDIEKWGLAALAQLDTADHRTVADYLRKHRVRFSETDLASGLLHLREKDVLTPDNRFVIHLMRLWLQKNRPIEQAREELTEANPIANRFIEIGLEFRESGDYEKAIEYFRQALSVATDNLQAQVNIALAYMVQDQLEQAVIEFEKALVLDDEDVASRAGLCEAHLKLGDAAMGKGRMKDAARSYQRVLDINEEHTEARQRMADMACQRAEKALADGRDEEAFNAFAEALKYTPEELALVERVEQIRAEKKSKILAAFMARFEKEARAQEWEAAVKTLTEASSLGPEDLGIQDKLAGARQSLHEKKLADLKTMAQGLADAEKFTAALETWQEYLSMNPNDTEQVEAAIAHIKQEQELFETYTNASRAISARDFDQAIRLLKEVIYRDENYKDASWLLTRAIDLRRTTPKPKEKGTSAKPERVPKERTTASRKPSHKSIWMVTGGLAAISVIVLAIFFGPKLLSMISSSSTPILPQASASPELAGTISPSPIESVQAYIASTPADFSDDFSSDKWGALAEGISTRNMLFDDVLLMGLEFGTDYEKLGLQGSNIEASQFALEFDFQFEEGNGDTNLDVGFPSLNDGTNAGFTVHLEEQSWTIELDGTISNEGKITDPLKGQRAHLQVIYFNKTITAILNGQFLGSADGIEHLGTWNWIVARTNSGAKLWLDNLKFWNLDQVSISLAHAEPAGTIPPASVENIQAYTTRTPPDFTDDFSSISYTANEWNQIAQEMTVAEFISDGNLTLAPQAGTDTEKLDIRGSNLQAARFALKFDFLYESGEGQLSVGFPSSVSRVNYDTYISLDAQSWSIELSDGTAGTSGEITDTLLGQWVQLEVIYSGTQLAVFLNGNLLGSLDEVSHPGSEIWIVAASWSQAKIRLDNIQFWNLDGVEIPSTPTEMAHPSVTAAAPPTQTAATPAPAWVADFAEPILQAIEGHEPDFQEDFSQASGNWSSIIDPLKTNFSWYKTEIRDGVMQIVVDDDTEGVWLDNKALRFRNFVLQVNAKFSGASNNSTAILMIVFGLNNSTNESWVFYLYRSGMWTLGFSNTLGNPSELSLHLGEGFPDHSVNITLISKDTSCAIYLNDTPITYFSDTRLGQGNIIRLGLSGEQLVDWNRYYTIEYDNLNIWNLDNIPSLP